MNETTRGHVVVQEVGRILLGSVLLLLLLTPAAAAQHSFVEIKERYFSAFYDEALTMLNGLKGDGALTTADVLEIEEYRALCLLALDRLPEAEHVVEGIVTIEPLHRPEQANVPPRMAEMFRSVRRRTLPAAAKRAYGEAKATFDRKEYGKAVAQFERVKAILDDPDLKDVDNDGADDLGTLVSGFLQLSLAAVERLSLGAAEPPPQQSVDPAPAAPAPELPRIYASTDAGVIPPVPVRQELPAWPPVALRRPSGRGVLELLIGESGEVESATLRQSVNALYDDLLLTAARAWRYKAALKDGRPVRFRKVMQVSLDAPSAK